MTRSRYFNFCMAQPIKWLKACAANPSPSMKPRHVALVRLAIRKKGG